MPTLLIAIGVTCIVGAFVLLWAGRPSATGVVSRVTSLRAVEILFPVFVMALGITGVSFVAKAFGY
jgi:hypothetical protein